MKRVEERKPGTGSKVKLRKGAELVRSPEAEPKPILFGFGKYREDQLQQVLEAALVDGAPEDPSASPKPPESLPVDRQTMEYAQVLAHAVDTFGSRARANSWLNRPSRVFNNQSPLQILTQDPAAVEEELVRIDHGMFL